MKYIKKLKSFRCKHLLAILFLTFCFYIGIAAFPQFLKNTGTAFEEHETLAEYVNIIDAQYHDMLTTDQNQPLLYNKAAYINFNGYMADNMGQIFMNDRFKLTNGHLAAYGKNLRPELIDEVFPNIERLYQTVTADGKNFLYVIAPTQFYQQEKLMPVGYEDRGNEQIQYLLDKLDEVGIPYLDMRVCMEEDGLTNSDAFFVTDHHWTPQTGFWAYGEILDKLAQMEAIEPVNPFYTDPDNFLFTIYKNSFLGSAGKRTGIYFAGTDDFCVISPKFETEISVSIPSADLELTGRWENISYHGGSMDARLRNPDYFNDNPYNCYGWGDRPLTQWRNPDAPEQTRIMLIGDSFGNVPFSLMPLYISSCDELDMRHFTGDFTQHYQQYNPDTVILMVNINSTITENTTFPYFADGL